VSLFPFPAWIPNPSYIISPVEYNHLLAAFQPPQGAPLALVLRVVDGDTIDVAFIPFEYSGARNPEVEGSIRRYIWAFRWSGIAPGPVLRVRLAMIDAPEVDCSGGQRAAYMLGIALSPGTVVALDIVGFDRYGRAVAWVWRVRGFGDAGLVNLWLVYQGMAIPVAYENDRSTPLREALFLCFVELADRYWRLCERKNLWPFPFP